MPEQNDNAEAYCECCHCQHRKGRHLTLDEMEKHYILNVYAANNYRKAPTARALGIDRMTLYARLARYS
jgi:transcriptional regulator with PAS, ATPase and Fis domain